MPSACNEINDENGRCSVCLVFTPQIHEVNGTQHCWHCCPLHGAPRGRTVVRSDFMDGLSSERRAMEGTIDRGFKP